LEEKKGDSFNNFDDITLIFNLSGGQMGPKPEDKFDTPEAWVTFMGSNMESQVGMKEKM